jgi:hypothetical protein
MALNVTKTPPKPMLLDDDEAVPMCSLPPPRTRLQKGGESDAYVGSTDRSRRNLLGLGKLKLPPTQR